jgi:hypothetical protein
MELTILIEIRNQKNSVESRNQQKSELYLATEDNGL